MRIEDIYIDLQKEPVDADNWDINKWREENPMDYLTAVALLNMDDNSIAQPEVFKKIYIVTRLHIPDVLYKYNSLSGDEALNEKKLQTLHNGTIFMSDIENFNDPFDGKGFYYNPSQLSDIERLRPHGGRLIDSFNSYIKATSLTANNIQSMPMWAHYGSNHTGFCVSYDMKMNIELSGSTFPVQYTDNRLDVTSLMRRQAQKITNEIDRQSAMGKKKILLDDLTLVFMACLLCNVKHASWKYEKEFRCTTGAIAKGMPFIKATPKEIYIGMNCASCYAKQLQEIAAFLHVPVYKMEFDECSEAYTLIATKC